MNKIVLFSQLFLICQTLLAQSPYTTFLFGDTLSNNRGSASVIMNDGTIYFAGTVSNGTDGSDDITVFNLDNSGNTIWQKTYGDAHDEFVNNMIAYDDTSFILCGDSRNATTADLNGFLLKINLNGDTIFYRTYENASLNEDFYGITKAANGDILIAGFITSTTGLGNDMLIARFDASGENIWTTIAGESDNDVAMGIAELNNGDIFISGDTKISTVAYNPYIAKLKSDGEVIFEKTFEQPYNSGCKTVIQNMDGNMMLVGESATDVSPVYNILLSEIDTAGNILWTQYLGDSGAEAGYDIVENPYGNFFITGYGYHEDNNDIIIMHTDRYGAEIARKYFGSDAVDYAYDIKATEEGDVWVSGFSSNNGDILFALIHDHFDPIVNISDEFENELTIYPNPVKNQLNIVCNNPVSEIELYNITGEKIYTTDQASIQIPSHLQKGIYLLKIYCSDKVYAKTIVFTGNL